jgi:hypothetical protein
MHSTEQRSYRVELDRHRVANAQAGSGSRIKRIHNSSYAPHGRKDILP